jgi:transcription elongation GreA/GreB family factor/RecA/RadA recombinase
MHEYTKLIDEQISKLRQKLMDTSRRSPLMNNTLSRSAASFIRIVDKQPNNIFRQLSEGKNLRVMPLPALETALPDEQTPEFLNAHAIGADTDETYLKALEAIDYDNNEQAYDEQAKAERALKDRVREELALPPRATEATPSILPHHARAHGINPHYELPDFSATVLDDRFINDVLQTLDLQRVLNSRLSRIYSRTRTMLEEKGCHVLYMTLGYLSWREIDGTEKDIIRSPLLLLPITLERKRTTEGETYSISLRDEVMLNPVLQHKLSKEFGVDIELGTTELKDNSVEVFFDRIAGEEPRNLKWRVLRQAVIGVYPFQGIELYNDLDPSGIEFSDFDVVSRIFSGVGANGEASSYSEYSLEDVETKQAEKLVPHLVLDADSSQFLALMKAASGDNMAIEGPPGSGKSQTIVNLIANAIATNKKVLFVAQKGTALQVVLSRMRSLGLDDLVLPLMGMKSDTPTFYQSLAERIKLHRVGAITGPPHNRAELNRRRDELNHYIDVLTTIFPQTALTVHQILGLASKHQSSITTLSPRLKRCRLALADLSMTVNTRFFGELADLSIDWSSQLGATRVQTGTIWAMLDGGSRDYRALDQLHTDTKSILNDMNSFQTNFASASLESFWDNRPAEVDRISAINELTSLARHKLPWVHLIDNPYTALIETESLLDVLRQRDTLLKLFSNTWENLTTLAQRETELESALKLLNDQNLMDYTRKAFENRLAEKIAKRDLTIATLSISDAVEHNSGLDDILLSELQILSSVLDSPLLNETKLLRYAAKVGFADAALMFDQAKSLRKELSDLSVDTGRLPSHTRVKELAVIAASAGLFSFLYGAYREAKKETIALFGLEHYSKAAVIVKLEALGGLYSQWEANPLALMLGDFREKTVDIRRRKMAEALESLTSTLRRHQIRPQRFADLAIPEVLEIVAEKSASLSSKVQKESWESLKAELTEIDTAMTRLSSALADEYGLLNYLASLKVTSQQDLLAVTRDLPEITKINQYFTNYHSTNESNPGILFKGYKTSVKEVELLKGVLSYFALITANARHSLHIEILARPSSIKWVIELLVKTNQIFGQTDRLEASIYSLGAREKMPEEFGKYVTLLQDTVDDTTSRDSLTQRATIYRDIKHHGFGEVVKIHETEGLQDCLSNTLVAYVVDVLSNLVYEKYGKEITQYSGSRLTSLRDQFKRLDNKSLELAPKVVRASAVGTANPNQGVGYGRKSEYTEMALIDHELGKKRRISPTKLIKRARQALLELHPCWMMVPTAVASYLPRLELFDLVVIDEASQMTPEHSVSALMRAPQAIIVGDTNQLPPTNFFRGSASIDEDDDDDITTVEESVLELANMKFHPKHRLQWHYRSRHESLIAFSNHYVYDDDLVIFPSPEGTSYRMGVELKRVDGTYHRGINPTEAAVMTESIIAFMVCEPDRSLGVVVMNQSQMEQIEAMIVKQSEDNEFVAAYIDKWAAANDGLAAFFVKNIENVQGDERDVIFIGTVYGADSQGRFRHHFGPINGAAGKRRLNVLFTRAKEKIITFSSIPMDKMIPAVHNQGATLLKRWLEYSAKGTLGEVLTPDTRSAFGPENPFEAHVVEEIEAMGFEAVPQVGVSNYYIDIGVRHSEYPYGYLCGVECDGASYHSARSARERDILRQNVLENLNWNIYRIWSTDWFRDGLTQRELLKQHLNARLVEKTRSMPKAASEHKRRNRENSTTLTDEVTRRHSSESTTAEKSIKIGSKIVVRYLDGPRQGMSAKLFLSDSKALSVDDSTYSPLPVESPLGQAVIDGIEGEIVTYLQPKGRIRVKIEEVVLS